MKTKVTAAAILLAVAIAATVVAANPFGSTRTIPTPTQGDPIPGVDVSIEQSPGGAIIASTQSKLDGTATFTGIAPGKYVVRTRLPLTSNNYNSSKCNCFLLAGATVISGSLNASKDMPVNATLFVHVRGCRSV